MTKMISATIEIAAAPERVWEVLTDLASYPQWNPVFCEATGQVAVGERIKIKDRKSTRLNSSHERRSRMPSSA